MIAHDQCWQRTEMPDNNGSVGEEMEASIDPLSVWGVVTEQQSTSRVGYAVGAAGLLTHTVTAAVFAVCTLWIIKTFNCVCLDFSFFI